MRALLKPPITAPHADEQIVDLVGRVRGRKIKVLGLNKGASYWAVDRYRLFAETDRHRRLTDSELATLPWQGAGPDPDTATPQQMIDYVARNEPQAGGSACSEAKAREPAPGRKNPVASTRSA